MLHILFVGCNLRKESNAKIVRPRGVSAVLPESRPGMEHALEIRTLVHANAPRAEHVKPVALCALPDHNDILLYALLCREGVDEIPQLVVATRLEEFVVTCGAVN